MSSPDNALQSAVEVLLAKLEAQEQTVRDTKKMINDLLRHIGKEPMFADLAEPSSTRSMSIRPDQFYGRPLATVAKEVLEAKGHAMPAQDIMDALERGGYDFDAQGWKEKDRLRNFSITLAKNTTGFHRLPNGHFGLPKWYPEAVNRKQSAKTERESAPSEQAAANGEDLPEGQ